MVGNYLKGEAPPPFDLLYWNGDSTNLPGPMYCWYLRHTYLQNELRQPGKLTVCGEKIDLGAIDAPVYIYGSREDHIVPWTAAYESTGMLKGKRRFVLGASGHIAGVINPASKNKRSHWTNDKLPATADAWFDSATEKPGSWWTDWSAWLKTQGGPMVAAPKSPAIASSRPSSPHPAATSSEGLTILHLIDSATLLARNIMTTEIVIVSAARTAVGKFGGTLAKTPAPELGAAVIKALLERSGVAADQIGEVILGQVLQAGAGQNPARQSVIKSGLPQSVPAMTINAVCGSGLKAVMLAAQSIRDGDSEIVIAGGQESMSLAPHVLPGSRDGQRMGDWKLVDSMITDGLWDVYNQYHMGITAENVAKKYGITREQQDALALASQQKAAAAQEAGRFKDEIVPFSIAQKKGDPIVFAADEFINKKTSAEALAGLRPAFDKAGGVTAGNASGLNDGAAAVLVMSAKRADQLGLQPLARIASYATVALDPAYMGMGPVPASTKALQRAGWKPADLDLLEINEAFAAQACAVHKEMGWDTSKVNVNGGAIAIGHPIGASGCRILVTLLHEMQRRGAKKGIASLCIGGGMGVALTVER